MTGQKNKIMNLLGDNEFHCTSEFYAMYIADPRSRLSSLKKDGYNLSWRWCNKHTHEGNQKEWRLEKKVQACCTSWILFTQHSRDCESLRMKEAQQAMF